MYKDFTISPFVFAGRKHNMEILFPYLNNSCIVDTILIGVNTRNSEDRNYIYDYCKQNPKFKAVEVPDNIVRTPQAYRYMFTQMADDRTIYIKMDDDILYLSDNFFEDLISFRLLHPEYLLVYPFVINNPYCNYISGWLKSYFTNQSDCMYNTWKDGTYAYFLLRSFAERKISINHLYNRIYELDKTQVFWRKEISDYVRPSINAICFFGKDCLHDKWPEKMAKSRSDEVYLTHDIYNEPGQHRKSVLYVKPHCVHYSFFPQKDLLNKLHVADLYKNI